MRVDQVYSAVELLQQRDNWLSVRKRMAKSTVHMSHDGSITFNLTTPEKCIDIKAPMINAVDNMIHALENRLRVLGVKFDAQL